MTQRNRLPEGGRLDRSRPLRFTFNGLAHEGYAGDTLASALLANGVALIARTVRQPPRWERWKLAARRAT